MAQTPNEVWTVDFKGWFRTRNGQRVDPLTVRDLFSRYILGIALLRPHDKAVRQYFRGLFRRYGLPKSHSC
jgi:transposase InsO family protein